MTRIQRLSVKQCRLESIPNLSSRRLTYVVKLLGGSKCLNYFVNRARESGSQICPKMDKISFWNPYLRGFGLTNLQTDMIKSNKYLKRRGKMGAAWLRSFSRNNFKGITSGGKSALKNANSDYKILFLNQFTWLLRYLFSVRVYRSYSNLAWTWLEYMVM